jgi:chromosome segregation ATPase
MKQGGSSTATVLPAPQDAPVLSILEAPSPRREEVELKLERAEEQLLALRRQQEELERQKSDLEDLRRKQDEYVRGKAEMAGNLARGLLVLEREQLEAQRLVELCEKTRSSFRYSLEQVQSIRDEEWTSGNLRAELGRALGIIENARAEFNRARAKLDCIEAGCNGKAGELAAEPVEMFDWDEMVRYARIGAAASAPLIVAGTVWLIILLVAR